MNAPLSPTLTFPCKAVMTSAEYHASEAIGSSSLKKVLRSAAHYKEARDNPGLPTAAQRFGTIMHEAILEPSIFASNFLVMPEFTGKTKDGKESAQSGEAKAKREAWCLQNHGKHILTLEQMGQVQGMLTAISKHKTARSLLTGGAAEESYFDQCPETGLVRKARPDFLRDGHIIVDVKTTIDASPKAFAKTIANYNYHLSAAYYLDVVSNVLGKTFDKFIILAVETEAPYGIGVYLIDEGSVDAGKFLYKKAMTSLKACKESGEYPAYSENVEPIAIPHWAFPFEGGD